MKPRRKGMVSVESLLIIAVGAMILMGVTQFWQTSSQPRTRHLAKVVLGHEREETFRVPDFSRPSDGDSDLAYSSSSSDEKRAVEYIRKALALHNNNADAAYEYIQKLRRKSQANSDDKALIYAHYYLKGGGMGHIFGKTLAKTLGAAYQVTKKYDLRFDWLSKWYGRLPHNPSPHDPKVTVWYEAGVDGINPARLIEIL